MGGVLCSGNIVLDILVCPVEEPAVWGSTVVVDAIEQNLGGNGANTSYTLAMMGVPARLLAMVGPDAFGDTVLRKLESAGVDTGGVRRSAAPTATSVVLVDGAGNRRFLHRYGSSAEFRLEPEDFEREIQPGMSHYHLASPFTLPKVRLVNTELLRRARAHGLTTSLDTQWDSQGKWLQTLAPSLPYVDILFVNEDEARMLTGSAAPHQAAAIFRENGARTVVIKLGAKGCGVFTPEGEIDSPGFGVPVVDTTGAGDCFVGGYLAALERGASHQEAARFANAVGAMTIQKLGAVEGVRGYAETGQWMATAHLKTLT
jgi:sugar/nucleoside kinase (ribokinase family)